MYSMPIFGGVPCVLTKYAYVGMATRTSCQEAKNACRVAAPQIAKHSSALLFISNYSLKFYKQGFAQRASRHLRG